VYTFSSFQNKVEARGVLRRSFLFQPPLCSEVPPRPCCIRHSIFLMTSLDLSAPEFVARCIHETKERDRTTSRYLLWPRFNVWSPLYKKKKILFHKFHTFRRFCMTGKTIIFFFLLFHPPSCLCVEFGFQIRFILKSVK